MPDTHSPEAFGFRFIGPEMLLAFALCAVSPGVEARETVFHWLDDDGRTVFSDRVPEGRDFDVRRMPQGPSDEEAAAAAERAEALRRSVEEWAEERLRREAAAAARRPAYAPVPPPEPGEPAAAPRPIYVFPHDPRWKYPHHRPRPWPERPPVRPGPWVPPGMDPARPSGPGAAFPGRAPEFQWPRPRAPEFQR